MSRRLFSIFPQISKNKSKELTKELKFLKKNPKFSLIDTITESEKNEYIKSFTNILNSDLNSKTKLANKKDENSIFNQHFGYSLVGLKSILDTNNSVSNHNGRKGIDSVHVNINNFDPVFIKSKIASSKTDQELLELFDLLTVNNKLTLTNFKLILFQFKSTNLQHFVDKLNFLNNKHEYDEYFILITLKYLLIREKKQESLEIFDKFISNWLILRDEGKLNLNSEKLLYQLIFKLYSTNPVFKLEFLNHELKYSKFQYLTLIHSLPKFSLKFEKIRLEMANSVEENVFSRNQLLFIKFLNYLNTYYQNPIFKNTTIYNNNIKKLLELSNKNKLLFEDPNQDETLNLFKFRFINGLTEFSEFLLKNHKNDYELINLVNEIHKNDEFINNETTLKFI